MIQGKPLACIVCISPDSLQQVQFIMYVLEPSFLQFINYEYFPLFVDLIIGQVQIHLYL